MGSRAKSWYIITHFPTGHSHDAIKHKWGQRHGSHAADKPVVYNGSMCILNCAVKKKKKAKANAAAAASGRST